MQYDPVHRNWYGEWRGKSGQDEEKRKASAANLGRQGRKVKEGRATRGDWVITWKLTKSRKFPYIAIYLLGA